MPSKANARCFNGNTTNRVSHEICGSYEILAQWAKYDYIKATNLHSKLVNINQYLLCAITEKNQSFP